MKSLANKCWGAKRVEAQKSQKVQLQSFLCAQAHIRTIHA